MTSSHLRVTADLSALGVRESGVLFHVVAPPEHGRLDVLVWEREEENIFTVLDLNTDKVRGKIIFVYISCISFHADIIKASISDSLRSL